LNQRREQVRARSAGRKGKMTEKASASKYVAAIALFIVLTLAGIFAIHSYDQSMARAWETGRAKAEQQRIAEEKESERIEMEAEQDRARLAQEREQEEKRLEEAKDQEQKRLAAEAEQKRLAEIEQERILSQIPVVLNSNNFVVLSFGKGTLWDCNGDGILFRENRLDRPAPWAMLTEADARALLGTQKGFDAATQFDPKGNTNFGDPDLEQQMGKIWRQGQTPKERLATRMEILGIFEKYNKVRARYFAALASSAGHEAAAQEAKHEADDAATQKKFSSFMTLSPSVRESYANGPSSLLFDSPSEMLGYVAANQIMSASGRPDYTKANQYSQVSSTQSAYATTAEIELNECLVRLAKLGLQLSDSAAYPIIPPMNLRREIVLELNSNSIPSARTNVTSTDTNAPSPDDTRGK
jgi:hypothetical protein